MTDRAWAADKVERWDIARLTPYASNPRLHSPEQIAQICRSIEEFGWTVPVLVDEGGMLIAGHGRVMAAQKLGLTSIPVMTAVGWSDAQKRAYVIADNQLVLNASWDVDLLKIELGELGNMEFDLSLTGFNEVDLATYMGGTPGQGDPEEVPEPPADPVTQRADIWVLGRHRVLCGDATAKADVACLMVASFSDLCFTSPPYAQQRDYGAARELVQNWDALMQGVFTNAPMAPAGQILVNLGLVHRDGEWVPYWDGWIAWMREQGWRRFGWYVWDQGPGLPGDWNGRLAPSHEFIFHFNESAERARKTKVAKHAGEKLGGGGLRTTDGVVKPKTGHGNAIQDRKIPDSVIRVMRHKGGLGPAGKHPAVFAVALAEEIINAFSDVGDSVYDPFVGSGTTIIAAEMTGRRCFALEIDPTYVDVCVARWEKFTGQRAILDGTDRTFADIANERRPKAKARRKQKADS